MKDFLNKLAEIKGVLPLLGILLVAVSLIAQFVPWLAFLTAGNWLLHVGVITGLIGLMVGDVL